MRYKSCRLLEHGIYFHLDPEYKKLCVGHCCNTDHHPFFNRLHLYEDLKTEQLDWDYVFSEKRKFRANAKNGIYPAQCEGCFELTERDWDDEDYINHLTVAHIMKCNSRCTYCPIGTDSHCHNREQDIDLKPIIEQLIDKKILRYDGSLRFVGGEPTLMKEFDWLVELFSKNNVPEIYVPTSGIRLSKSLCKALEKVQYAAVVTSVDAGTKETFARVKGTNFFDIVNKNLKTYLLHAKKKNFVIPKFILFTNYNDYSSEIEAWLANCKKAGFVEVQFDAELSVSSSERLENKKYVKRTLQMLKYAEIYAKTLNLKISSNLAFMNRTINIYENHKNIYKCISDIKDLNDINNIDYNLNWKNLYLNLDDVSIENIEEQITKLVQDEKFAPTRKAILISNQEITTLKNFDKIAMFLIRLGFDLEFSSNKIFLNKIIHEILKTSNSRITLNLSKNNIFMKKIKTMIIEKNYSYCKLGNISII